MFRRPSRDELEPARRALDEGRYDDAFDLLARAAERPRAPRAAQAEAMLELASLHALYGPDAVEDGEAELDAAADADPAVVERPLFRALEIAFGAMRGAAAAEVKRAVRDVDASDEPEAAYHLAHALVAAGANRSAAAALERLDPEGLPGHLRWRRDSLLGLAREGLGRLEEAADAYRAAAEAAAGPDREVERLNLAGVLVELGRPAEALETLDAIDRELLPDPLDRSDHAFLAARAHLGLANPNRALDLLLEARALQEAEEGAADHEVLMAQGQVLVDLERYEEAVAPLEAAVEAASRLAGGGRPGRPAGLRAPGAPGVPADDGAAPLPAGATGGDLDPAASAPAGGAADAAHGRSAVAPPGPGAGSGTDADAGAEGDTDADADADADAEPFDAPPGADEARAAALHELGFARAESGDLEGALDAYRAVLAVPDYPYLADALADQAELLVRLGDYDEARGAAERSLELGGPPSACLTLGTIAFEYFRLDEAVTWYERAAADSDAGDGTWVQAQQLLADVFAQRLPGSAERLLRHARAALAYTDPHSEWYLPLRGYVEQAQAHLGGHDRLVN